MSCEPLLGTVRFVGEAGAGRIDWVICGGESGPGARPMQAEWARSLRDQCLEARVPFFFKQWGTHKGNLEREFHAGARLNVKKGGSLLDGREWKQFPEVL